MKNLFEACKNLDEFNDVARAAFVSALSNRDASRLANFYILVYAKMRNLTALGPLFS